MIDDIGTEYDEKHILKEEHLKYLEILDILGFKLRTGVYYVLFEPEKFRYHNISHHGICINITTNYIREGIYKGFKDLHKSFDTLDEFIIFISVYFPEKMRKYKIKYLLDE